MAKDERDRLRGAIDGLGRAPGHHGADPAPTPAPGPAEAGPATMHKGAVVVATLLVEGEDPPAHDFAAAATAAARAMLAAGLAAGVTPLAITIRDVAVDDDSPDRDA